MSDATDPHPADEPANDPPPARVPRHNVMLSATVERCGKAAQTKHRVRDLSASGVRIDNADDMSVGATVLFSVGLLSAVPATVVWAKDGSAGLKFEQPINPDDARGRAAIVPKTVDAPKGGAGFVPTAGWIGNSRDRYRG